MEQLGSSDPREVGPYRLAGVIGKGAMGRVYLGLSPGGRKVAVKVIRPEHISDPEFRQRFRREVDAAMRVGGLHTALVLGADPDADSPWMATAYIPGPTLHETVHKNGPLGHGDVRDLGAALAEGLTQIHECGLVHRDLKPSNILMASDGPRIIDFGVTQADSGTWVTQPGLFVGTPAYMSPEQIDGGHVGPQSDVFALGGVLVYAATGRSPFGSQSFTAIAHAILNKPPDLRSLTGPLRDTIAACLARNPAARPAPASLIKAFGSIPEPSPPSSPALRHLSVSDRERPVATVTPTPSPEPREIPRPQRRQQVHQPRPAGPLPPQLQVRPTADSWWLLAADPASRWIAAADGDGTIAVWDPTTTLAIRAWPAREHVLALAASRDNWLASSEGHGNVRIWDVETGTACASAHLGGDVKVLALDWPTGLLATGGHQSLRIWDVVDTREPIQLAELPCEASPTAIAFGDDGNRVAAGFADGWLHVWDIARVGKGEPTDARQVQSCPVLAVAWDDAGRRWLSVGADGIGPLRAAAASGGGHGALIDYSPGQVNVFPLDDPARQRRVEGCGTLLTGVAFAGSGLLVAGGASGTLHAWDGRRHALRSHPFPARAITAVAASPNAARVAACDDSPQVTVFDIANGTLVRQWSRACPKNAAAVALSPDGSRLAVAGDSVRAWTVGRAAELSPLPDATARAKAVAFDQAGEHLAAAGTDGIIRVWQGARLRHALVGHKAEVYSVAFGPDGHLVSLGADETIRVWDLATGKLLDYSGDLGCPGRVLAIHPTDGSIALGCADGTVRLCARSRWTGAPVLDGHVHGITSLCFDLAGRHLATSSLDGTARVWNPATRSAQLVLAPEEADGWAAAEKLPDGKLGRHGPAEGAIWQALGLRRQPLYPQSGEDDNG